MDTPIGNPIKRRPLLSVPTNPGYFWGGESLPWDEACKHFAVVGATGAGKSITLNMLLQSVLVKLKPNPQRKRRVVVYDAKSDLASFIVGVNSAIEPIILNPLDSRFTPWDVAKDIRSETDAYEFASILIPRNEKESSPYFNDTARSLIAGVIKRFNAEPNPSWTLRDLVLAFETKERLQSVLDHKETRYLQDHFLPANEKNFAGVKSTVDNVMAMYRPIAALFVSAAF